MSVCRLVGLLLLLAVSSATAEKTVYIPQQFGTAPWNEWSLDKTYQSANFCIFWGNKAGKDPTTNTNPDLRFDPKAIATSLEASFTRFVTELGFVSNDSTTQLGRYKIIVVMNETYEGAGGPTGWAFGSAYDNTIGAMWVHPNATRDPYVLSHEFAHTLQAQNHIQENRTGGFTDYEPAGWFWECHANYMRCLQFPQFASDDMPRWTATGNFHLSSTRHHYSAFRWLMHIQQNYGGIAMINRLWHESAAREDPVMTLKRLKGWSQSELNDFMFEYASHEATLDYPAMGFGDTMRATRSRYRTTRQENHWLWRVHTLLSLVDSSAGRYAVPEYSTPQDYGFNIIPLHLTCSTRTVHVKFRGHTNGTDGAGWRWGFVAANADASRPRYGSVSGATEGEATLTLLPDETQLYLVVVGAPTSHTSYVWEPGWPKLRRHPYEVRIENARPEGYNSTFRDDVRQLFPGHAHPNGGGFVANEASVSSTVYVGPQALVLGASQLSGNVHVEGTARVERVAASGNVIFANEAHVVGGTYGDQALVRGRAILYDCHLSGTASAGENAFAWGVSFGNGVVVGGDAELGDCSTPGLYRQTPHPNNGREECDGKGANDNSNIDINPAPGRFTSEQMAWTPIGCEEAADVPLSFDHTLVPSIRCSTGAGNVTIALEGWKQSENLTLRFVDLTGREILRESLGARRKVTYSTIGFGSVCLMSVSNGRKVVTRFLLLANGGR